MIEKVSQLKEGSVISESSHYIINRLSGSTVYLTHFESGEEVQIGIDYLKSYTNSADLYTTEVKVTKEDKKDGTPGIRTIFEGIHSGQVFTVCFKKQDKPKSNKQFKNEVDELAAKVCQEIDRIKASKKGIADWAKKTLYALMSNPIPKVVEGEDRVLRGYKVQFESRDGRYNCVDMDIQRTDKENGIRPVNILTIKWLIYNGVKYTVE